MELNHYGENIQGDQPFDVDLPRVCATLPGLTDQQKGVCSRYTLKVPLFYFHNILFLFLTIFKMLLNDGIQKYDHFSLNDAFHRNPD